MLPRQRVPLPLEVLAPRLELREVLLVPLPRAVDVSRRRAAGHVARLADQEPVQGHGLDLSFRFFQADVFRER